MGDSEDTCARERGCGSHGARWFCASTHPQQQYKALSELLNQQFEAYLPLHLDRQAGRIDRIEPLFGRYLFVRFDADTDPWGKIRSTRGIQGLICHALGRPTPLPHGIVENLIERTSPRRIVDDPGVVRGVVYLAAGARGRVVEGPFQGWEGLCTLSGSNRVRLLLEMFGSRREVEFKAALVTEA